MVSSQFGTYLCNAEKERREKKLKQRTHSVWSYLYSRQDEFINPLYDIGEPAHQAYLYPELGHQHYKLWTSMYCRFDPDAQPRQNWVSAVGFMSLSTEMHKKRLEITALKMAAAKEKLENPEIQTRPRRRGSAKEELELAKKASIASALDDDDADEWIIQSPVKTSSGIESSGRVLAKVQSSKDRRESGLETLKGAGAAAIKRSAPLRVVPVEELQQPPPLQSIVGANSCNTPGCKPFEYLSHRQHCLSCGKIFCSACTNKHLANPAMKFDEPIPTCNSCAKEIKNANALAEKAAAGQREREAELLARSK
eukprot:gene15666-7631_t